MSRRLLIGALLVLLLSACGGSGTPNAQPAAEPAVKAVDVPSMTEPQAPAPELPAAPGEPKRKVVVLDPGHGGDEVGSAAFGVVEKQSNLDFALRVERLLLAQGVDVILTRRNDARAASQVAGFTATRSDLQARIDLANQAGGDVFVSLHSNGSTDPSQRGVEAWFDSGRAFGAEGRLLAGLLVSHVLGELRSYGYNAVDRGLFDGRCFRQREGRCFSLFVIGGPRETTREDILRRGGDPEALGFRGDEPMYSVPANMPAALVELLVITNAADATVLRTEQAREAMARGVAAAILEFLSLQPAS